MIVIVLPDIAAEDRLLEAARRGDQDAMFKIYDSYFPPIYNFIRLRVEDRILAEDLASEVLTLCAPNDRARNRTCVPKRACWRSAARRFEMAPDGAARLRN